MQKKISIYVLYLLIGVFLWGGCLGREDDTAAQVVGLKCRGLVDPIGIDEPIFSWQIVSEEHGFIQSAWEIEIASSLKALETGDVFGLLVGLNRNSNNLFVPLFQSWKRVSNIGGVCVFGMLIVK